MTKHNAIRIYTILCRSLSQTVLQLRMDLTFCSFRRIEHNICLVGSTSINKRCAVYYYPVAMHGHVLATLKTYAANFNALHFRVRKK